MDAYEKTCISGIVSALRSEREKSISALRRTRDELKAAVRNQPAPEYVGMVVLNAERYRR